MDTMKYALEILEKRSMYWHYQMGDHARGVAYDSALAIICAALEDNVSLLRQFDCYEIED